MPPARRHRLTPPQVALTAALLAACERDPRRSGRPAPGDAARPAPTSPVPPARRCPAWSGRIVVRPDPRRDPAVRVAIHAPEGFRADRPWALILHLHGSGDCGARTAWCGPTPRDVCPNVHAAAQGDCTAAMIDAARA